MNASFRGGMQVHAVPDDERALDVRGQPLPWAYAYADSTLNRKQAPIEKGPFGKPLLRQSTAGRQRTATPAPRPDNAKKTQEAALDNFFNDWKKGLEEQESRAPREQKVTTGGGALPVARSATDLTQPATSNVAGSTSTLYKKPTEVKIYGYGADFQYAAIDFYESASGGRIYEDYDRFPPNPRYNTFLSTSRPGPPRDLPQDALRAINRYQGGNHWIKVTFESPAAADRACSCSPHVIHGYKCYAELWQGVVPKEEDDVAIPGNTASTAGAVALRQRKPTESDQSQMPSRMHSAPNMTSAAGPLSPEPSASSSTASSATAVATGTDAQSLQIVTKSDSSTNTTEKTKEPQPLTVRGAKRAVLLPASTALLPVVPWSQRTFGHLPLVGSLVGGDPRARPVEMAGLGGGGFIGNVVPRDAQGRFDWARASWWWRACWLLDGWIGTDLLGMKGMD